MDGRQGERCAVSDEIQLRRLSLIFLGFCMLCFLAGASRLSPATWNLRHCADVLRVREILSMFIFAPILSLFFWLFYKCLAKGKATSLAGDLLCILSIWLVACGMGLHDPSNCLQSVYRQELSDLDSLRRSLEFIDDALGHWVFWAGFVLGTWTLGIRQLLSPLDRRMSPKWSLAFGVVTVVLLGVMLTNLWNEYPKTQADLAVIALAAGLPALIQLVAYRGVSLLRLPLLLVIHGAYWGSVAGTLLCWQARYRIFF